MGAPLMLRLPVEVDVLGRSRAHLARAEEPIQCLPDEVVGPLQQATMGAAAVERCRVLKAAG